MDWDKFERLREKCEFVILTDTIDDIQSLHYFKGEDGLLYRTVTCKVTGVYRGEKSKELAEAWTPE